MSGLEGWGTGARTGAVAGGGAEAEARGGRMPGLH